eukprot:gene9946-biopygen7052
MEHSARRLELTLQIRDLEEHRGRAAAESTALQQQINVLEGALAQELAAADREWERLLAQLAEAAADAKKAEDQAAAAVASLEQQRHDTVEALTAVNAHHAEEMAACAAVAAAK